MYVYKQASRHMYLYLHVCIQVGTCTSTSFAFSLLRTPFILPDSSDTRTTRIHSRGLNLFWFWKIVKIVMGGKAQKEHVDEDKVR